MLFKRRSKRAAEAVAFPGTPEAVDGVTASLEVTLRACEAAAGIDPFPTPTASAGAGHVAVCALRQVESPRALAGLVAGWAAAGMRVAANTQGRTLAEMREALCEAAGQRLPFVVLHTCEAARRQDAAWQGEHDACFAVADTGLFVLFARNAQEAADLTLIAHRLAESSLNPGLCAQDGLRSGHSVQIARLPAPELVAAYLGTPGDVIESPTPAQAVLFGARRRRLPALFDVDRPLGLGAAQDQESALKALTTRGPFFFDHVATLADEAMASFAALTGRLYARAAGYRMDDAAYVVVAQGALAEDLEAVIDYLREREKIKAGVLNLTLFRPFPGDLVSGLLKGKKAVTVLEGAHGPLAEDPPLLREIRCAVDKAAENGACGKEALPYTDHAVYAPTDRPRFFSGVYGAGTPSFSALCAVVKNMLPGGTRRRRYYLGVRFDRPDVRMPEMERLQQTLRRGYPGLPERALAVEETITGRSGHYGVFEILTADGDGASAGGLLARALFEALHWRIKTAPQWDESSRLRPLRYTIAHAEEAVPTKAISDGLDALVVAHAALLAGPSSVAALNDGGVLVVHTESPPATLWGGLSAAVRRQVRAKRLRCYTVDARRIADEITPDPSYAGSLATQALLGAFLAVYPPVDASRLDEVKARFRPLLTAPLQGNETLLTAHLDALRGGAEAVAPLAWEVLPPVEEQPVPEPEAPWTVRAVRRPDGTVYDLARFWHSVGYLYETGREEQALADPFVATGTLPARSSAFRSLAPLRVQTPRLLPERCTACGACWTLCPDAALPVTIQDLASLVETALAACEDDGRSMLQLRRVSKHLVNQAHRLFAGDERHSYLTLGDLLQDAFARLLDRMTLNEDQRAALEGEFQPFHRAVARFPIVKTETFFKGPEKAAKGTGLLFSLAVNPDACTGCGLCVGACPEAALEMAEQAAEEQAADREGWRFLMRLPDVAEGRLQGFVAEDRPETLAYHLLRRRVYHAVLGGDHAAPGSGVKTAVRLAAAAVEALMQPRVAALVERLDGLIARLEDRIQGTVKASMQVNDFEAFNRQLAALQGERLTLETLAALMSEAAAEPTLDREALCRLTDLLHDLKHLRDLYRQGAHGDGRARMAMTMGAGRSVDARGVYPYNPYPFPWIYQRAGDVAALAEGAFEGVLRRMADGFKAIRLAQGLLDDTVDPDQHAAAFARFGWQDFTQEEHALCPPFVVLAEEASEAVFRLLRRRLPIKVLLINTGTWTDAPGLAALAGQSAFVLQASIGNPGHLLHGLMQGMAAEGPALFHVYAPEPAACGIAPESVAEHARLAVESRAFPLFSYHPEAPGDFRGRLRLDGNPDPEADWTTQVFKVDEAGGLPATHEAPFTFADWAAREARFRHQFRLVPRKDRHPGMTPLAAYLALPTEEREGLEPFIERLGADGKVVRKAVSPAMVAATEDRRRAWILLLELAGVRSQIDAYYAEKAGATVGQERDRLQAEMNATYEAQATAREQTHAQRYHDQLTRQLLRLSGYGPDAERRLTALRDYARPAAEPETEP